MRIYGEPHAMAENSLDNSRIREAFARAVRWLHERGDFDTGMLPEKPVADLVRETAAVLREGISYGIGEQEVSAAMRRGLNESAYVFSGFKTFHEMNEAAALLRDENGRMKPFGTFSEEVRKIDENYNRIYLRAEYNFARTSAEMATKWEKLSRDGDRYDLQYRTAGDTKVRSSHRAMDGITLPPSDPFWGQYFPPNDWGCRCNVVRVRSGKYPRSDHAEAISAGESATSGKYGEMFRFNPGKDKRVFPPYNPYTVRSCKGCDKDTLNLARPANQLCAACAVIQRMKCAASDAREWARKNIDERKGLDVMAKNLASGSISVRRSTVKDIIGHTRDLSVIMAIPQILQDAGGWKYIGWGPVKKNPRTGKRKHPEAEYFLYYETEVAGVKRYVNVKAHYTHKREVPYCILDKCSRKHLRKGAPPGIDKYKKKQDY